MNIALAAHNSKKELLIQFCTAYSGVLSRHKLCAVSNIALLLEQETDLEVMSFLSETADGSDKISARVMYDEIDMVLIFRDPLENHVKLSGEIELMRLCDGRNIPFATNIGSAEILIHGLDRGDLDWREIARKK